MHTSRAQYAIHQGAGNGVLTPSEAALVNGGVAKRRCARVTLSTHRSQNVTANTVRVQGLFHDVATGNRARLTFLDYAGGCKRQLTRNECEV